MEKTLVQYQDQIDQCFNLFIQKGIRGVSIDDIVRACNISKKEIYNIFGNKEGVVREVLQLDRRKTEELFCDCAQRSENAIEEMLMIHQKMMDRFSKLSPLLFFDLKKYHKSICDHQIEAKLEMKLQFIHANLARGIKEEIYRNDIDVDIVAKLWASKMEMVREQRWFSLKEYDLTYITKQFTDLHLRSIANHKGRQIINAYFSSAQNQQE